MSSSTTHPSLLSRVRDRDNHAAWRTFEQRYSPLILAYCRKLGMQLNDAEDVRQQVMLNLAKSLPGFQYDRTRGRFRTYLWRVVRNAMTRHAQRHNNSHTALSLAEHDQHVPDDAVLESTWEEQWRQHHCRLAMNELRQSVDRQSIEVFERLLAGDSYAAIAQRFNMTEPAVRKVKQRIRDRLSELIAKQIRDEEEVEPHG